MTFYRSKRQPLTFAQAVETFRSSDLASDLLIPVRVGEVTLYAPSVAAARRLANATMGA